MNTRQQQYTSQAQGGFESLQNDFASTNRPGGETSEWLTATEAAAYLKVKPRTLLLWVRQGKVKAFPLSGTRRHVWRFRRVDLDAMLTGPAVLNEGRIM
jgi:excisionase family DNA binding protein